MSGQFIFRCSNPTRNIIDGLRVRGDSMNKAFFVLGACCVGLPVQTAEARSKHCREVRGTIVTSATSEGCESPIGLCFEGELKTPGFLRGETFFTATSAAPIHGTTMLSYTGLMTLRLANGRQIELKSQGEVDLATLRFVETQTTDELTHGQTTLDLRGTAAPDLSGFTGTVAARICGAPEFGRRE